LIVLDYKLITNLIFGSLDHKVGFVFIDLYLISIFLANSAYVVKIFLMTPLFCM